MVPEERRGRPTEVLHFALGVRFEVARLLGPVDADDWLDLAQSLNVHHVVLHLLSLVDDSV